MNDLISTELIEGIKAYRKLDNYKVIDNEEVKNNLCLVCFSSNGLYYPNNSKELSDIINNDRYEWYSVIEKKFYKRVIFIRDIYKQWYLNGINNEISSVDALSYFLKEKTKGFDTTYIGSSAGGYAAVLFGGMCNANKIISFSGQFNLEEERTDSERNSILSKNITENNVDLSFCNYEVFYVGPSKSKQDKYQHQFIKNNQYVKSILVASSHHGVPLLPFSLNKFIRCNANKLRELEKKEYNIILLSLRFFDSKDFYRYARSKYKKLFFN